MTQTPIPLDDYKRLNALRALKILDTPPDERFERITRTAARLFNAPMVALGFIDTDREWIKASYGLTFSETPRRISLSARAILEEDTFVIPDTRSDPRCGNNPLVVGEPFIRFYAGHPVTTSDGSKIGVFYIMDQQPRQFSPTNVSVLRDLAAWAESEVRMIELEHAHLMKDDLLAAASHEIRTPMNSVIGMIGLLLETNLNGEQLEMVEAVRTSSETLMSIINGILDFSMLESGQLALEIENFEPQALVETTVRLMHPQVRQKSVPLTVTIDPDIPPVLRSDPGALRQVLLNLLDNAIKFTDKGEIRVEVKLDARESSSVILRFAVHDTGIGVSDTARQNLFQPFTRVDKSQVRRLGGTGLGLAICKRLVEILGGQIGLESQEGTGSTFWFIVRCGMPSATISSRSSIVEASRPSGSAVVTDATLDTPVHTQTDPKPMPDTTYRILLAEDNVVNQKITLHQLHKLGYTADSVINGVEALEAVNKETFNLVLMDCQMPIMDGFEATMKIRETEAQTGKHIPIVAMTANVLEGDREACINAGMDDYIGKPVSLDQLREVLGHWLPIDRPVAKVPPNLQPTPPASPPTSTPIDKVYATLDAEALDNLRKLVQPPFLNALIEDFIKNTDELLTTLHSAIESRDQEVIVRTAHTLKSSSANYGAKTFSALCRALEHASRAGQFDGAQQRLSGIEEEYQKVKIALGIERNRGV